MLKVSSLFSLAIFLSIIAFLTCKSLPTNPYENPKNVKVGLFLNGNKATALQNESILVGVVVNIPSLIKSIRAVQGDDSEEVFLSLNNPSSTDPDTVYFETVYKTIGTKQITIKTVLSDNTPKDFEFEIEVIPGNLSVWKQDLISIEVPENSNITKSLDSLLKNPALSGVTFSSNKGTINGNVWRDSIMWGAAEKDSVTIYANYNGIASVLKVMLNVIPKDLDGPRIALVYPAVSDVNVSAKNVTCNFTITDSLSGVGSVVFKTGSTILTDTLHSGNNYQCVVKDLVQGEKTVLTVEAFDKSMKKTKTTLNVSLTYDPDMVDNVNPKIVMKSPSTTNAVVSTSETSIKVICTDESGIDTVTARKGTTQLNVERTDSLYSVVVSGLTAGKTDTIVFEAVDKSSAKNKAPLSVYITYDASSLDTKGPKITLRSPASNNTKVSSPSVTLSVICYDDNKVASAAYKTGTLSGNMMAENDSVFTATIVGLVLGENKITITAKDKSTNANSTDSIFSVIYEQSTALSITKQPVSQTICPGSQAVFSITATGTGTLSYQWRTGAAAPFTNIGSNSPICSLTTAETSVLSCVVSTQDGTSATSSLCTLSVNVPAGSPTGKANPDTILLGDNKTVTLSVATGTPGTGGTWVWYASDKTTKVTTNPFTPTASAAYYVRSENAACGVGAWSSAVQVTVNQPAGTPTGKATPASVCLGDNQTVTLSIASGDPGTGGSWVWYADDKATKITTNPFTPKTEGISTYYVRSEGGAGGAGAWSAGIKVMVNQPAGVPTGTATPTSVCLGSNQQVTLSATGTTGTGGSWVWYEENKTTKVTTNPFTPSATKSYYVRSEGSACGDDGPWSSLPVTVTVNEPASAPTSIKASTQSICGSETVTLEVVGGSLGTGGATWKWYTDASCKSPAGSGEKITPKVSSTTTYYVRAEGGSCDDITSTASTTITVETAPAAPSSITSSVASVCGSGSVTLKINGGSLGSGGATWKWYKNGSSTSFKTGTEITETVTSTTTYSVKAEGGTCNNSTTPVTITIPVNVAAGTPSASASKTSICQGESVELWVTGEPGTGGSWVWYESDQVTIVQSNKVSPQSTKTYFVRSEKGACGDGPFSTAVVVNVKTQSIKPTGISVSERVTFCPGTGITLTVTGGTLGTNAKWVWSDNPSFNNPIAKTTSPTLIVKPDTSIYYYVRAEGDCGTTTAASTSYISVNELYVGSVSQTTQNPYNSTDDFEVYVAAGSEVTSYQWQRDWNDGVGEADWRDYAESDRGYSGGKSSKLSMWNISSVLIRCVVTDVCGNKMASQPFRTTIPPQE
ncbi:MAG: hypothetical protein GX639_06305 [Fibrobacter sp.]|nr:hypothetical protein [Fibrobacter sp.]